MKMVRMNKFNTILSIQPTKDNSQIHKSIFQNKNITIEDFRMQNPFTSVKDFPLYIGYYFREIFKNSVKDLKNHNFTSFEINKHCENSQNLLINDENFHPNIASVFIEQNK